MGKKEYFNIQRPHDVCLMCGRSLQEAGKHPSSINLEEGDVLRRDFCGDCWEKIKNDDYFSYWLTKRITPERSKRKLSKKIRNNLLVRLFESVQMQSEEERDDYLLYFIAHLLLRYKEFNWKGTKKIRKDDEDYSEPDTYLVFENKTTGEDIMVKDQEPDAEKIMSSRQLIDDYLQDNAPAEDEDEEE